MLSPGSRQTRTERVKDINEILGRNTSHDLPLFVLYVIILLAAPFIGYLMGVR